MVRVLIIQNAKKSAGMGVPALTERGESADSPLVLSVAFARSIRASLSDLAPVARFGSRRANLLPRFGRETIRASSLVSGRAETHSLRSMRG